MFEKSSIFIMLLLVTGSLIGISSIYQPVNVETQPQQQQPLVPPDQTVKKPPTLVPPKPLGPVTGVWKGQDQGIYYVRQFGDNIMWLGTSANDGKTWTNAFAGKIDGDIISGTWADVPRGKVGGLGTLTLKVSQVGAKIVMQKIGGSTFSTFTWEKQ